MTNVRDISDRELVRIYCKASPCPNGEIERELYRRLEADGGWVCEPGAVLLANEGHVEIVPILRDGSTQVRRPGHFHKH